jgi:hypothetical protein
MSAIPMPQFDPVAVNDAEFATIVPEAQIIMITGGYRQPSRQLAELHRQGFFRARVSALTGKVVLEREHYVAVCQGIASADSSQRSAKPKVRLLKGKP